MTEPEFDVLLKQALLTGMEKDFDSTWASDGPEPAFSEDHRAWQEKFLTDPSSAAKGRMQEVRRRWTPRRTSRIVLVAALALVVTLSAALALAPGLKKYWNVTTEQVTLKRSSETVQFHFYEFQMDTLSTNTVESNANKQAEPHHWYPQWLPKTQKNRFYKITLDDLDASAVGKLEYEVRSTDFDEQTHIYGKIELCYSPMAEIYTTNVGLYENYTHYWEEVSVGGCPGFFLFVEEIGTTTSEDDKIPSRLIWFDFDAQTVFELCGNHETDGYSTTQLLKIAKSVKAGNLYP